MDNFKIHKEALIMSDIYSSYNIARNYLETAEKLESLETKYVELNKMLEDLLRANKVLQDHVDVLTQQQKCVVLPTDWRVQFELES